jgi:phospholipid transport system substrate-binding protein
MIFHVIALALAVVLLAGGVSPASAGPARDRIRDFFGSVNRLLADPAYDDRMPERLAAVRALVVELVDFRLAAALALGEEWTARTAAERDEFARLFAELLQSSVLSSVGGRARLHNGLSVTYVGELDDGDGVTVATSVLTRAGSELAVGYRMTQRQGRWMVYDVVIDGVSLVDNYRAQFQKVMGRSSYAGLVGEMRTRLDDLRGPTATAAVPRAPITVVTSAPPAFAAPPAPAAAPQAIASPQAMVAPRPPEQAVAAPVAVAAPARDVARARPIEAAPVAARDYVPVVANERTLDVPVAAARTAAVAPAAGPRITPARGVDAYWVQVGAFRNVDTIIDVAAALRDQQVSLVTGPDEPLTRVLVGPFADRSAAASKLRELRARGYQAFIANASPR